MSFEDIPEDLELSYPCTECMIGDIVKNKDEKWECNECGKIYEIEEGEEL